jgi:hypothetical protein
VVAMPFSGGTNLPSGQGTVERWFNTDEFSLPGQFSFGNAPRDPVVAPGFANVNMLLQKTWLQPNGSRLEPQWEIFNVLN